MGLAAARAKQREDKLRENGIPVKDWGNDETLMNLYALEIREARQEYTEGVKARQIEASNGSEAL